MGTTAKTRRKLLELARRWRAPLTDDEHRFLHSSPEAHFDVLARAFDDGELATDREVVGALGLLFALRHVAPRRYVSQLMRRGVDGAPSVRERCHFLLVDVRTRHDPEFGPPDEIERALERIEAAGAAPE